MIFVTVAVNSVRMIRSTRFVAVSVKRIVAVVQIVAVVVALSCTDLCVFVQDNIVGRLD